ncbi:methanogen output domain 1-containing protein [Roseovarius aquimarinus]|uniref:Methanogen output domain 1-containing protein n=1 Tax=Roseovarius aquimarinus TaxID=1229156 RepID=A0ABW7I5N2_9RHOB
MPETKQVDLDRTGFYLEMIAHLTTSLENVIGLEDAEGYYGIVGTAIGERLSDAYAQAFGRRDMSADEIGEILVDLKRRIDGGFRVASVEDGVITLTNDRCPFGEKALGRKSLCMMTSNVFGTIASEASGQANVELQETIAAGDGRCCVKVYLNRPEAPGLQYFGAHEDR